MMLALAALTAPSLASALTFGTPGSGAGQLLPSEHSGLAFNQATRQVYVADTQNHRVDQFTSEGAFVRAWGADVGGPGADICTATCESGTATSEPGGFDVPMYVAVDNSTGPSAGYVYVAEPTGSISKFAPSGNLDAAWGDAGQLSVQSLAKPLITVGGIAVAPNGDLDVFGANEEGLAALLEFSQDGTLLREVEAGPRGPGIGGLDIDSSGNYYKTNGGGEVEKLDPSGFDVATVTASETRGMTFDRQSNSLFSSTGNRIDIARFNSSGEVEGTGCTPARESPCPPSESFGERAISGGAGVAVEEQSERAFVLETTGRITAFLVGAVPTAEAGQASAITTSEAVLSGSVNPGGRAIESCTFVYGRGGEETAVPCDPGPAEIGEGVEPVTVTANVAGLEPGTLYEYKLVVEGEGGRAVSAISTFKTSGPPTIDSNQIEDASGSEARVVGRVNPEGLATSFRVEYGTSTSYGQATPSVPVGAGRDAQPVTTTLKNLIVGFTYHARIVATNSAGTVFSGDMTFVALGGPGQLLGSCPNEALRSGGSTTLPDCRSWEMVSPVDKNGSSIQAPANAYAFRAQFMQSSESGERLAYSSYRAFGDAESAPYAVQYLAARGQHGWVTHAISPHRDGTSPTFGDARFVLESEYKAFSPDFDRSYLVSLAASGVASGEVTGFPNVFERDNQTGKYTALLNRQPQTVPALAIVRFVGATEDGSRAFFEANVPLTADAAQGQKVQLYEWHDGDLQLVSVLPGGEANPEDSAAGSNAENTLNEFNIGYQSLEGAISADGSHVFWTSTDGGAGLGEIYVRIDGQRTQVVSSEPAVFRYATPDGNRVLYETSSDAGVPGNLVEADITRGTSRVVAGRELGVLGTSRDMSYIYLVSEEDLAEGATEGSRNLYVDHEGRFSFIAELSELDLTFYGFGSFSGVAQRQPNRRNSRVTPDGTTLAFMSFASLEAGYDNNDQETGQADAEIYMYSAETGRLLCASCNPTGVRPRGQTGRVPYTASEALLPAERRYAAWLPTSESSLHSPRSLSENGRRLFFNSSDPLVTTDTNGAQDVYEWEADGEGTCDQDPGCIYLISSGESERPSEFVDADRTGGNVFFETASSLTPDDPGATDIYDARVDGGFESMSAAPVCQGEACQPTTNAPNATASNSTGQTEGNFHRRQARHKRHHRKHRHKGTKHRGRKHGGDRNRRDKIKSKSRSPKPAPNRATTKRNAR